jgi:hypothetical protein
MQHQQELTRRPIGAMDGEPPAAQIRFGADGCPMTLDDALIIVAPRFSAPGSNAAGAFRLYKLDTAGVRKAFFSRINDLHDMSVRAGGKSRAIVLLTATGAQRSDVHDFDTAMERTAASGTPVGPRRNASPDAMSYGWRSAQESRECRRVRCPHQQISAKED